MANQRTAPTNFHPASRLALWGIGATSLALALGSCVADRERAARPVGSILPQMAPSPPGVSSFDSQSAVEAGVVPVAFDLSSISDAALRGALAAYRISCPSVTQQVDRSGLTRPDDWQGACDAATRTRNARRFFNTYFTAVRVGDGGAFATGYYEPQIAGRRRRARGYDIPVYAVPDDLIDIKPGESFDSTNVQRIRGRIVDGALVPYFDRAAIEAGALEGRAPVIGYAADPVELFFLHVQGSGRLIAPDGSVIRIGYAGQNGHNYVGIGKLLSDRGVLPPDKRSMQGIMEYLRADPERGMAVMRENPSYIFFQELKGAGPLGALGRPVTPRVTVAADPRFVPLGAPILLDLDRDVADGLWVAQDTGGAIKGANRFDTFWGAGAQARTIAGGMSGRGRAAVLVPIAAAQRLATALAP